jgi:hypothetical protein
MLRTLAPALPLAAAVAGCAADSVADEGGFGAHSEPTVKVVE